MGMEDAAGIQWVAVKDASNHSAMHTTDYQARNANGHRVEKHPDLDSSAWLRKLWSENQQN